MTRHVSTRQSKEEIISHVQNRLDVRQVFEWKGSSTRHGDLNIIILCSDGDAMVRLYKNIIGTPALRVITKGTTREIVEFVADQMVEYGEILDNKR